MSNYIEYNDTIAFHPGYYLEELFEESCLSQEDFAGELGITAEELIKILNGDQSITEEIAIKISEVSMTTPSVWLDMQRKYDKHFAEMQSTIKKKENKENYKVIKIMRVYDDMGRDEYHEIYDIGLKDGSLFHRFKTHNGEEYSAIYQNTYGRLSHERVRCKPSEEEQMISKWNASLHNQQTIKK